jgi:DNA polymerase-1
VPGIGEKTAAKLLGQYGCLENLWTHLEQIPGEKLRKALEDNRELILRNREMVRLREDLDCPLDWDRLKVRRPEAARLIPFLEACEFHSLAREQAEQSLFSQQRVGVSSANLPVQEILF